MTLSLTPTPIFQRDAGICIADDIFFESVLKNLRCWVRRHSTVLYTGSQRKKLRVGYQRLFYGR